MPASPEAAARPIPAVDPSLGSFGFGLDRNNAGTARRVAPAIFVKPYGDTASLAAPDDGTVTS